MENVVEVENLHRDFGITRALRGVSLSICPGRVYGLVGGNGQGKTTLIKHLLGLLRAQKGVVRVFGLDPVDSPEIVLGRIGYLSENRDLPEWMRVDELLRYVAAFHVGWDAQYAAELVSSLQIDTTKKIKHLSKGMRAQTALIAAAAHRPELLLLDEPSTGLDAVVRKDILSVTVRTAAENGSTVLFSSHLLDEVEQMSDEIIMIDQGRVVLTGEVDELRENHFVVTGDGEAELAVLRALPGVISAEVLAGSCKLVCEGDPSMLQSSLMHVGVRSVQARPATLQDTFVARAGRDRVKVAEETANVA
ncbi:MAG: hypothetical protein Aurels2KO_04240 [Aureliella sp.]